MRQVLINQSAGGSRRWGLFCISSGDFSFSWQEVLRAYWLLKEELSSFNRDSPIPPLFKDCVYLKGFPHLEVFLMGQGSQTLRLRWQQKWVLEIRFILLEILAYRWVAGVTCFSLCTVCGQIQANVKPVSMWAILLAFHNCPFYVVSFRVKVKSNYSLPAFKLDWNCLT